MGYVTGYDDKGKEAGLAALRRARMLLGLAKIAAIVLFAALAIKLYGL